MKMLTLIAALLLAGCSALTADAPYKAANRARLQVVEPWLADYAKSQPAATTQRISDVLQSWHIEVNAQQAAK